MQEWRVALDVDAAEADGIVAECIELRELIEGVVTESPSELVLPSNRVIVVWVAPDVLESITVFVFVCVQNAIDLANCNQLLLVCLKDVQNLVWNFLPYLRVLFLFIAIAFPLFFSIYANMES